MSVRVLWACSAANVAFGVLIAASALVRLAADDAASARVAAWPALVGAVFGIFGLIGLYLARGHQLGRWGPVAFVCAMTGLALSVGQFYGLTYSLPGEGPLGPLFPLGYGPFLFGFLVLDLALLMIRDLPRLAILSLVAGAALNAAGFATPEIRLAGVVAFGAGIAWLGFTMVAKSRPWPGQERLRPAAPPPSRLPSSARHPASGGRV